MMPVKKYNRVPSLFGDFFADQWSDMFLKRATTPQVNIVECDKKYKVEIAAPGMSKDDLKIDLTPDNQLVVSLEKDEKWDADKQDEKDEKQSEDEKRHYLRREFSYTSFRQVFNLPDSIDRDKISAKMKHGVLCIKLPKKDGSDKLPEAKHISIE